VHRDVNPANVFLSFDGEVKLGDFGVAVTAGQRVPAELAAGTPGHAAPEQLSAGALEQSADVFAGGILMYGLLCGRWPFDGGDRDETIKLNRRARYLEPTQANPGLSPGLASILACALERKPRKRYPDAGRMLAELDSVAPKPVGMPLVVRSMLRTFFFREYVRALQMRAGLSGQLQASAMCVSVCSGDASLANVLQQRGITVLDANTRTNDHRAILLDARGLSRAEAEARLPVVRGPVVVLGSGVNGDTIELAHRVNAVDLVTEPVDPDRLHAAVWSALYTAAQVEGATRASRGGPCTRILLVSRDGALCNRARELDGNGYVTTVVGSADDAAHYLERASARIAVLDLAAAVDARTFAERVRGSPGIDQLPILALCEPERAREIERIDRAAALAPDAETATLAAALGRLLEGDVGRRRSFCRYRVDLPATLTYGGRAYSATATDLSRGGAMLDCSGMLPVGANVAVSVRLDGDEVQMRGHILRVAPGEGDAARVGVRISSISREAEACLVRYIAGLSAMT